MAESVRNTSRLIEQQDVLIRLVEQVAHGHAATKKDTVTSSTDDASAPADEKLPVCYAITFNYVNCDFCSIGGDTVINFTFGITNWLN